MIWRRVEVIEHAYIASMSNTVGVVKIGYTTRSPETRVQEWGRDTGAPDRGDAVVMAFTRAQDNAGWQATDPNLTRPRVNRGHENKRRS